MREFNYSKLKDKTFNNEILIKVANIHEAKGRQALYLAQKPEELRELQLVEGVVIDQIESKPEYTDKDGNVKKAKEAKILFQLSNGQEGYLLMKDAAGITDEEDLDNLF